MDINQVLQAVVAMLVITSPPDPAKILLFNSVLDDSETGRTSRIAASAKVSFYVLAILSGALFGGAHLAKFMGIDLNAFTILGGIVVAGMGFEMLYGGQVSRAQGRDNGQENKGQAEDGLLMPLAIPLIAGPGAIVTTVAIAADDDLGFGPALIGVIVVAAVAFCSFAFLGSLLTRLSERTTALLLRLGGMLLATIGIQMVLNGIKEFFMIPGSS